MSYSTYCCANALLIIKFEWLTQTNCETQQYISWVVPRWAVLDQLLANIHLTYEVMCSMQGYMDLIIHNALAQQCTE